MPISSSVTSSRGLGACARSMDDWTKARKALLAARKSMLSGTWPSSSVGFFLYLGNQCVNLCENAKGIARATYASNVAANSLLVKSSSAFRRDVPTATIGVLLQGLARIMAAATLRAVRGDSRDKSRIPRAMCLSQDFIQKFSAFLQSVKERQGTYFMCGPLAISGLLAIMASMGLKGGCMAT